MMIPTLIAAETGSMDTLTFVGLLLGSNVVNSVVMYFAMRRKTKSEADKNDTDSIIAIGKAFRELLVEYREFCSRSMSAEEANSMERIASREKLADLEEKVENCEQEHIEWNEYKAACSTMKANMMEFLMTIEPQIKQITGAETLLEGISSLRTQIQKIAD